MPTQMFLNLSVKDLDKSVAFFKSLGFAFNPQFTNDSGACMVVSENHSYVMLLTEKFFTTFTPYPVSDAKNTTEVLIALSQDSREAVANMVRKAVAAGATTPTEPKDHGFMVQHGFQDLDGHMWEVFWMDTSAVPGAAPAA